MVLSGHLLNFVRVYVSSSVFILKMYLIVVLVALILFGLNRHFDVHSLYLNHLTSLGCVPLLPASSS